MAIRFRCEHCGQKLRVADDKVGQLARCPKCQTSVAVPAPSSEPNSEAADATAPAPPDPREAAEPVEPPPVVGDPPPDEERPSDDPRMAVTESPADEKVSWRSDRPDSLRAHPVALESFARDSGFARHEELPEIVVRDDWEDDYGGSRPAGAEVVVDYDKVAVPRRVLYFQGLLLALVAVVSFVLGTLVKQPTPNANPALVRPPATLTGQVTYGADHQPDIGAVVIVLPNERRPEPNARLDVAGLRPSDPAPLDDHPTLRAIRALGGELTRTNNQGAYQTRLPQTGRYYVLIISRRGVRGGNDRVEVTDMAQMGRYFATAIELLEDRRYLWRTMTLTGSDMFDADFE